jgi:1-acyl-sn-glycerol-3-phosphate acyltransferase
VGDLLGSARLGYIANVAANEERSEALVAAILGFLTDLELLTVGEIGKVLRREIEAAGPAALVALKERLVSDDGWDYYPPDPLSRRIHHLLADHFLAPGSELRGSDELARLADGPVVIIANHLSYADANVIEVLLHQNGGAQLASRLTALAGPKIFSSRERRFSSLCFGNIKVPQSADVASEDAVLSAREVARAARFAIGVARQRLQVGDALLLFAEGTRSRTAQMQSMLAGATRYLDVPGTQVLPLGLTGSEDLFPVDSIGVHPAQVIVQVGRPFRAEDLMALARGDRRLAIDATGLAVAELLPPSYRGAYKNASALPEAEGLLREVRSTERRQ